MTDFPQRFGVAADDRAYGRRAIVLMLVAGLTAIISGPANAAPPVPFYTARVTQIRQHGGGSVVISTKDSVATVCAWYRLNLHDQNGETVTDDGAHIFYTHSGATVDVEPANIVVTDTSIGLTWDAKKFGAYSGK